MLYVAPRLSSASACPAPRSHLPSAPRRLAPRLLGSGLGAWLAAGCASSPAVAPTEPSRAAAAPASEPAPPPEPGRAAPPSPSSGCGRSSKAAGLLVAKTGKLKTPYLLTLPEGYDGSTPVPLVFAFHGRTRSHQSMHDTDASHLADELGKRYAVAYVKSVGVGYDQPREQSDNLQLFDALHAQPPSARR